MNPLASILMSIFMIQDPSGISPEILQYKNQDKSNFFPIIEGGREAVIMTYWYDSYPWVDGARSAWIAVNDGYAMEGVDHVSYHVSGRGTFRMNRPAWLRTRNAPGYWIGFTGSNAHASEKYGKPVALIEIADGETVEVSAILVDKKGHKAISSKPMRIGVFDKSENPLQPWRYQFD